MNQRLVYLDLSRFIINVANFIDSTPLCVIEQIAKSMSLYFVEDENCRDTMIHKIKSKECIVIEVENGISHLTKDIQQKIISFVNFETSFDDWTASTLETAFFHVLDFRVGNNYVVDPDFKIGMKTSQEPYLYDPAILYRICLDRNIKTTQFTTMEEMGECVKNSFTTEHLVTTINEIVSEMEVIDLIKLKDFLTQPIQNEPINVEHINVENVECTTIETNPVKKLKPYVPSGSAIVDVITSLTKKFEDFTFLINRFTPLSHEEAAYISAYLYGIDVTESIDPMKQYLHIKRLAGKKMLDTYLPIDDPTFKDKYMYAFNDWYKVLNHWNPKFNSLYNESHIKKFCQRNGYLSMSREENMKNLFMSRAIPSFHLGVLPKLIKDETSKCKIKTLILQDTIEEVKDSSQLITYGTIDDEKDDSSMVCTVEGYTEYLKNVKSFTHPVHVGEIIPKVAIDKLKQMCIDNVSKHQEFGYLYDAIILVETLDVKLNSEARIFKESYIEDNVPFIDDFLEGLLELGMYMRGWKVKRENGEDPILYPLEEKSTFFFPDEDNYGKILINVSKAIHRLEKIILKCPNELKLLFTNLPLIIATFDGDKVEYIANQNVEMGLTIMDRILICKEGDSIHGCIRMSSDKFLSSYCFYSLVVGTVPKFSMSNVDLIS